MRRGRGGRRLVAAHAQASAAELATVAQNTDVPPKARREPEAFRLTEVSLPLYRALAGTAGRGRFCGLSARRW